MDEIIVNSNTCGYIKIDRMFISDVDELYMEYLKIKEKIKKEIIEELSNDPKLSNDPNEL